VKLETTYRLLISEVHDKSTAKLGVLVANKLTTSRGNWSNVI